MSSIIDDVRGQYLDDYGKLRVINYDHVSLMTPPLPPLEMEEIKIKDIKRATTSQLFDIIEDKQLFISSQVIKEGKTVGVWVEKESENLVNGYIPTDNIDILPEIDEAPIGRTNPLEVSQESLLNKMKYNSKVSLFLCQYVLYEYSRKSRMLKKKDFVIIPDHVYNFEELDKKFIPDNDIIYRDGKIIVHNKSTRDKLLSYLKIQLFNRPNEIKTFSDRVNIENYYLSLSDFSSSPSQYIFLSIENLRDWKNSKQKEDSDKVRYTLSSSSEPFFYRGKIGKGKLFLVQNVSNLEDARKVGETWYNEGYNLGPDPGDIILQDLDYILYLESGVKTGSGNIMVLKYNDEHYAALLPIEK